jgi:hypothetical protein
MKRVVFLGSILGTIVVFFAACLVVAATLVWFVRQWEAAPWVVWAVGLALVGVAAAGIWRWWRLPAERRFRFSLRGMLVGVTLFALWLGVIGVDLLRWGREVATVVELSDRGVRLNEGGIVDPLEPFGKVRSIGIRTDSGVSSLLGYAKDLPDLEWVNFRRGGVSDAALDRVAELDRFPNLRSVMIEQCNVTDLALERLANWGTIEVLYLLHCTKVTDAGVVHVARLQQLRHLHLTGIPISDAGIAHLHNTPNLRRVELSRTKVTEKGIDALCEALPDCFVTWDNAFCPAVSQVRQIEIWSKGEPQRQIAVITEVEKIEAIKKWIDRVLLLPGGGWKCEYGDGPAGNSLSVRFEGHRRRLCEIGLGNGVYLTSWGRRYRAIAVADEEEIRGLLGVDVADWKGGESVD